MLWYRDVIFLDTAFVTKGDVPRIIIQCDLYIFSFIDTEAYTHADKDWPIIIGTEVAILIPVEIRQVWRIGCVLQN